MYMSFPGSLLITLESKQYEIADYLVGTYDQKSSLTPVIQTNPVNCIPGNRKIRFIAQGLQIPNQSSYF